MTTTTTPRIASAVIRQIDECGLIDSMRDRWCDAAQLARLNRLLRAGELTLTPVRGWGIMTHATGADGTHLHLCIED